MNFPEQMSAMNDDELYAVLSKKDDYLDEAISAAENEFQKRGLDPGKIESVKQEQQTERMAIADQPLSGLLAFLLFLFPLGLPQFLIAERFRQIGATRKSKETWRSMWIGIAFYAALSLFYLIQRM
jgi:hypothetical protein